MLIDLAREPLQAGIVGKVPHDAVTAGKVNHVELTAFEFIRASRISKQVHDVGILPAPLRGFVKVGPFQRARLQGHSATLGTHNLLLGAGLLEHVVSVRELGQPQTGRS